MLGRSRRCSWPPDVHNLHWAPLGQGRRPPSTKGSLERDQVMMQDLPRKGSGNEPHMIIERTRWPYRTLFQLRGNVEYGSTKMLGDCYIPMQVMPTVVASCLDDNQHHPGRKGNTSLEQTTKRIRRLVQITITGLEQDIHAEHKEVDEGG